MKMSGRDNLPQYVPRPQIKDFRIRQGGQITLAAINTGVAVQTGDRGAAFPMLHSQTNCDINSHYKHSVMLIRIIMT